MNPERNYIGAERQLPLHDKHPNQVMIEAMESERNVNLKLKQKLEFAHRDPLTQLEGRGAMFKNLEAEIQKYRYLLVAENFSDVSDQLDRINLSVTIADLAYLTKFNEDKKISPIAHKAGDEVLREVAKRLLRITEGAPYRIGGDEFAIVHKRSFTEALPQVDIAKHNVQNEIILPNSDLPTSINCGTVGFKEAVEVFYNLFPDRESREHFLRGEARGEGFNYIADIFKDIADVRVFIEKITERVNLMVDLFIKEKILIKEKRRKSKTPLSDDEKVYSRNLPWIKKGLGRISETTISDLADLKQENEADYLDELQRIIAIECVNVQKREGAQKMPQRDALITSVAERVLSVG